MSPKKRYAQVKRASFISAATNSLLAVFKIVVGIFGNSHALIADGLHSFSDLVTDGLVLIAAKAGGRMPDKEHPYGHRRIETIAAILIAFILIFVAGFIVYEIIDFILSEKTKELPNFSVIIVAAVSVLANEWLYRYMVSVGKKINSSLLISNAWHNRSDALTSIIVLVSVIGTLIGIPHLDSIGAIVIAFFILKIGVKIMWDGIKELIDTAVDEKTLSKIVNTIKQVPGVRSIHQLRTRLHGNNIFIDVHIIVDPFISVSEGHHIGEQVHINLSEKIKEVSDVTVHIDPEDDEITRPSTHLPSRKEINEKLKRRWKNLTGFDKIKKIMLHYIEGRLYVEVFMPDNVVPTEEYKSLCASYQKAAKDINEIAKINIHFMHE